MASAEGELEGFAFSDKGRPVGEGEFGKILEGLWHRKPVAVKVLSAPVAADDADADADCVSKTLCDAVKALWSELRALPKHANIASYAGVAGLSIKQPSLVRSDKYSMSLAHRATLEPRVEQRQRIDIAGDIIAGLAFLHGNRILHGRLQSTNVLLSDVKCEHCCVYLCDAAVYRVYDKVWPYNSNSGNVRMKWLTPYVSPELERASAYAPTVKSDVFAFGLVVLAMEVCREPPNLVTNPRSDEMRPEIERHAMDLATVEDTNPLKDVIVKCIGNETYMRPTSEELSKKLQSMKTSDEYIAANAVSRARAHLPADMFSPAATDAGVDGGPTGDLHLPEPDAPGFRSDRVSASSDLTYPRLLHRESGPMVASTSMVSLADDGSVTGSVTGGPSLASDGGSVTVDLPRLLGQVRTQLDSLRRSVLIVAHDMDDVRVESVAAHRQAYGAHQAAMAARDEASEARRQASGSNTASQAARDQAKLAHHDASGAKEASLRVLSTITSASFATSMSNAFGAARSSSSPLISKQGSSDSILKIPVRDSTLSLTDIHELDLHSNSSDRGSTAPMYATAATTAVASAMDEAPPGYLAATSGGAGMAIASAAAMEPPPGMAATSSAGNLDDEPLHVSPAPGAQGGMEYGGGGSPAVGDLGAVATAAAAAGAGGGTGSAPSSLTRAVQVTAVQAVAGRRPSSNSYLTAMDASSIGMPRRPGRVSGNSVFASEPESNSLRVSDIATKREAPVFISHVRRFDFALKCTLAALKHPSSDHRHRRVPSGSGDGSPLVHRAVSKVFEQASMSASQAFPFGEWTMQEDVPVQVHTPRRMCVLGDTLYLVCREVSDAGKRTYLIGSTNLEKWTEIAFPPSAATCHAMFAYNQHLYVCARSTDKADSRGRSRGDVIWRLDETNARGDGAPALRPSSSSSDGAPCHFEWIRVTQMPHIQWHYGAALDGTRAIFAGGWDGRREVGHVVVYDLSTNKWLEPMTSLPIPAFAAQAFVTGDHFYLIGATTRQSDLAEVYYTGLRAHSVNYNKWRTVQLSQSACGACLVNKHIVTVGGWDNVSKQASDDVSLFDVEYTEWLSLPSIKAARVRPEVVYFKNKLVCLAGSVNPSRESDKVSHMEVLPLVL
eukprot:scpid65790/ scgid28057/ Putative serine/threonine-protein kinase/receptor R831